MKNRIKSIKHTRIYALLVFLLTISLLIVVFLVPKRPFFWLTNDMVEKIEHREAYRYSYSAPRYITISEEDKQLVVWGLRQIKVTRPVSPKAQKGYSGGKPNPFRVTLKSGKTFCFESTGTFCTVYFKNGEHAGFAYEGELKPVSIILRCADDRMTKKGHGAVQLNNYYSDISVER